MCTHGPEDPERATIPFVVATAALASDVEAIIGFQSSGVMLMRKECANHVFAAGFPPLSELLEAYQEAGGKLYVCGPCVKSRKIDSSEFIEGAEIVNAATFVKEFTEAANVLVY
jgi:predicted peroxiredoxin